MTLTAEENGMLKTVAGWLGCQKDQLGSSVEIIALAIDEAVSLNQVFLFDKLRIQVIRSLTVAEFLRITRINDKLRKKHGFKREEYVSTADVQDSKITTTEWGAKAPPSRCRFYYLAKEI